MTTERLAIVAVFVISMTILWLSCGTVERLCLTASMNPGEAHKCLEHQP